MSRHNMMTAAKNNDKKWRSSGSVLGSQTQNYTEFGKCKSEHLQPPKSCQLFFFAANLDLSRAICSRSSTTLQQIHTDPTQLRKSRDESNERWICVICHFKRPPYALLRVPTPLLALQDETALPGHHPTVLEPGEGDTRPGTMQEMCHCRRCWRRCSKHLWIFIPTRNVKWGTSKCPDSAAKHSGVKSPLSKSTDFSKSKATTSWNFRAFANFAYLCLISSSHQLFFPLRKLPRLETPHLNVSSSCRTTQRRPQLWHHGVRLGPCSQ